MIMKDKKLVVKSNDQGAVIGALILLPVLLVMIFGLYFLSKMVPLSQLGFVWFLIFVILILLLLCSNSLYKRIVFTDEGVEIRYLPFVVKKNISSFHYTKNGYKTMRAKTVSTESITVKTGIYSAFFNSVDTPEFSALFQYMINSDIPIITEDEDYIEKCRAKRRG